MENKITTIKTESGKTIKIPKELQEPKLMNGRYKHIEERIDELCFFLQKKYNIMHNSCFKSLQNMGSSKASKIKQALMQDGNQSWVAHVDHIFNIRELEINPNNHSKGVMGRRLLNVLGDNIERILEDRISKN